MDFKPESIIQSVEDYKNVVERVLHVLDDYCWMDEITDMNIIKDLDGRTVLDIEGQSNIGCTWSYRTATIPIEWMAMSDEELKEAVKQKRIEEKEEKRLREEAEEKKKAEMEERHEREMYERLKKKYEGTS